MRKLVLGASALTVIGIGAAAAWLAFAPQPAPDRPPEHAKWILNAGGAEIGGPFELVNQDGETVTEAEVIDGPTLVYFGYTWCPDVCPIDTQLMIEAVERLDAEGVAVDPVFITVDPGRDDVASMKAYAEAFHPRMQALTGSPEQIAAAAEAYSVYYEKQAAEDTRAEYLVNHTAFVYFLTEEGLAAIFRHSTPPEVMAAEIRRVLADRASLG